MITKTICAACICIALQGCASRDHVQSWQYKVFNAKADGELMSAAIKAATNDTEAMETWLMEQGAEGWELCSIVDGLVVFKRPTHD